jgi:hypothetical protein
MAVDGRPVSNGGYGWRDVFDAICGHEVRNARGDASSPWSWNEPKTFYHHFATQLPKIGWDKAAGLGTRMRERPYKQGLFGTARYGNGRPQANYKTLV